MSWMNYSEDAYQGQMWAEEAHELRKELAQAKERIKALEELIKEEIKAGPGDIISKNWIDRANIVLNKGSE